MGYDAGRARNSQGDSNSHTQESCHVFRKLKLFPALAAAIVMSIMPFHQGIAQRALSKTPGRFPAFTCTEFRSPDFQQLPPKIYQCTLESHFYLADNRGTIGGGMFQRHPFIKTQDHAWTILPHVQYGQTIAQRTEVTGIALGKPYWLVGAGTAVFTGTQAMGILVQTPFLEPFEKFFQNAPTTQWWLYVIPGSAIYFVDVLKDKEEQGNMEVTTCESCQGPETSEDENPPHF